MRGDSYKASFSEAGFVFIPYLGREAPRNYPFALTPTFVGAGGVNLRGTGRPLPRRAGENRVAYDHGTFEEIYEARPEGVEQLFVIPVRAGDGDLVVRLEVETDLGFAGLERGEHLFAAPGLGGVRFGTAVAVDARGNVSPAAVGFAGGVLEVRVPGSVAASASYPLAIDPVLVPFTVDATAFDDFAADVSFDVSAGKYAFTFEETFSAADHDVLTTTRDLNGSIGAFVYQDFTAADWRKPRNADNREDSVVLVVADVGAPGSRDVRGRLFDPGSGANASAAFDIAASATNDEFNADVGGSPAPSGGTRFAVVWEREITASDHDIRFRTVDPSTLALGSIGSIDVSGSFEANPAISKGTGPSGVWTVAYERKFSSIDFDIRGHRIGPTGSTIGSSFFVDDTTPDDRDPDVATDGTRSLFVFQRAFGTDHDLAGRVFVGASPSGPSVNLTQMEPGAPLSEDQVRPTVDADGCRFVYAYAESFGGSPTDYDVVYATVRVNGGALVWDEGHRVLPNASTSAREDRPSVASRWTSGGTGPEYAVAFDAESFGGQRDIHGATIEALSGTLSTSIVPTSCGLPSPSIAVSGTTALNGTIQFTISAAQQGTTQFLIGAPGATPLCAGAGPCVVGMTFPPFLVFGGNALAAAIPCDAVLVGGVVAVQGVEFGVGLSGGCFFSGTSVLLSNTIQATLGY